ncbi:MAG TPA: hypothetical protein VJH71_01695 [Candidatus Paceibacterota bacterium]
MSQFISPNLQESITQRFALINNSFRTGVTPAAVVSCKDGILLVTFNGHPRIPKIKQVGTGVAFVSVGEDRDRRRIYKAVLSNYLSNAYLIRSPGDPTIIEEIKDGMADVIAARFKDIFSSDYFSAEFILASLGRNTKSDLMFKISFYGQVIDGGSVLLIPDILKNEDPSRKQKAIFEGVDFKQLDFRSSFKVVCPEVGVSSVLDGVEVVTLSREILISGNENNVYHRLRHDEVKLWLE